MPCVAGSSSSTTFCPLVRARAPQGDRRRDERWIPCSSWCSLRPSWPRYSSTGCTARHARRGCRRGGAPDPFTVIKPPPSSTMLLADSALPNHLEPTLSSPRMTRTMPALSASEWIRPRSRGRLEALARDVSVPAPRASSSLPGRLLSSSPSSTPSAAASSPTCRPCPRRSPRCSTRTTPQGLTSLGPRLSAM